MLASERSGPASIFETSKFEAPNIRSPIRYNLITKGHYYKMSLTFISSLPIDFLFLSLYPFSRFWYICTTFFKSKKSHVRRSRTIIVRPFHIFSSLRLSCAFFHTHTLFSPTHAQFAVTHICVCMYIFIYILYKQTLRKALTAISTIEPIKIVLSR